MRSTPGKRTSATCRESAFTFLPGFAWVGLEEGLRLPPGLGPSRVVEFREGSAKSEFNPKQQRPGWSSKPPRTGMPSDKCCSEKRIPFYVAEGCDRYHGLWTATELAVSGRRPPESPCG